MSEHGAALQTYNQELVKCLEDLKRKRNDLLEVIRREEAEESVLEKNIQALQDKMGILRGNMQQHKETCDSYNTTIIEAERSFQKILESSQTLLEVIQVESEKIGYVQNDASIKYMNNSIYHNL